MFKFFKKRLTIREAEKTEEMVFQEMLEEMREARAFEASKEWQFLKEYFDTKKELLLIRLSMMSPYIDKEKILRAQSEIAVIDDLYGYLQLAKERLKEEEERPKTDVQV